jgi:tetratricopeptide (TPR) repeat protein
VQVLVLTEVSRYDMLADRNDSAIEVGREALALAEQLGLDDLRARAFNNIGVARVAAGDPAGIEDVARSVALAEQANDVYEMVRSNNNLGIMYLMLGDARKSRSGILEAYRLSQHYGHHANARWSASGPVLAEAFHRGGWDDALQLAEESLADPELHYQSANAHGFRGLMRAARGDLEGAESDAERAIELARPAEDPQLVLTVSTIAAVTFMSVGNERRASETLDDVLAEIRQLPQIGFAAVWAHGLAWVARMLGRPEDVVEAIKDEPADTPWIHAARAVAAGEFVRAADIFVEIGAQTLEAFYRLRAAEALVAEGRRAEADAQLGPALAFYRAVGATRYVREGEALLAASA